MSRQALGVPGFMLTADQRYWELIRMVGGTGEAARIVGKAANTIRNWGKDGAQRPMDEMLKLCEEASVSLDWLATGYQVRPDLEKNVLALAAAESGTDDIAQGPAGFVRLLPVRPELTEQGGAVIERWNPSEIAVSAAWLDSRGHLTPDTARYAIAGDDGMRPLVLKGAMVIVDTRPQPVRSGIYLVGVGDELLVRRLVRLPDGGAELAADLFPASRFSLPGEAAAGLLLHRVIWAGQDI